MEAAPLLASIASRIESERARWHVPGLAVGVRAGGESASATSGVADLDSGTPVRPETVFRIASITKPFLASLALTLVQDGLLDLDRPLDDFQLPHPGVPLRHLLSHQAGLLTEWPVPIGSYGDGDDCLERLAADSPAALPLAPGELFSYSNAGFSLAGAVLARAAGTTFEEAMHTRVLEPLGLADTGFETPPGGAAGHVQVVPGGDEHRRAAAPYPRGRRPSGGLYSTVADLLAFAAHLLGGPGPLSPESRAAMQAPHVRSAEGHYGLGLTLRSSGGRRIVEHGGAIAGYRTLLLISPDEDLALVALTNSGRGHAAIYGLLDELGLAREVPEPVSLGPDELAPFAGDYGQGGTAVAVAVEGSCLRIEVVDTDPIAGERRPLVPLSAWPVGPGALVVPAGEERGTRIELPRADLLRIGARLFPRL